MSELEKVLLEACFPYYDKQILRLTLGVVELSETLKRSECWVITLRELELPNWHNFGIVFTAQPCTAANRRLRQNGGSFVDLFRELELERRLHRVNVLFPDLSERNLRTGPGSLSFELHWPGELPKLQILLEKFAGRIFNARLPRTPWQLAFQASAEELTWTIIESGRDPFGKFYREEF